MAPRLSALTFDASETARLATFWAGILDRPIVEDGTGVFLPGSTTQVGLRFVPGEARTAGPNRVHLHLTSASRADQQTTVSTALALGARHLDVGQTPEEGHIVLADPDGNEFCVIEPHNSYLAGSGFLGEVACDGTRAVGLFWAAALDWPLVWEEGEETAIQSPHGGTKVAWGGPPVAPKLGRNRQRLELLAEEDLQAEVGRLLALGATPLSPVDASPVGSTIELADPDGNEFAITGV